MLRLLHYRKSYGPATVLHIEQLQLDSGVYWLRGENGAGKTTLLKSIAGLIPFEGSIDVDGVSLRRQRRHYTKLVSIAEAEPVYPLFLTGRELVQFYLQTKGGTSNETNAIADVLGIAPSLSGKVGTYSSGMLKKLSLLLAFTGRPSLVLLDEPLITLDGKAVAALRDLIASCSLKGTSFLISSHQEPELPASCHRLYISQHTLKHEHNVAGAA